jgi:hypothetical protein
VRNNQLFGEQLACLSIQYQMKKLLHYASISAVIMLIGLAVCSIRMGTEPQDVAINATIMILGSAFGWLCGTAMTPFNDKERGNFTTFAKAASAFISGYLVGKVDKAVETVLSPVFLSQPLAAFRVMLFAASVIIALMLTIIYRWYYLGPESPK